MNNFITEETRFFCGIDLHKRKSFIYVLNDEGRKVKSTEIETLREEIINFFSCFKPAEIIVALEVGSLTFSVCDIIRDMGISIYVVNTLENHYLSRSMKKTDKQDAKKLAIQLWKRILPRPIYIPCKEERDIRQLISHRHFLVKDLTRIKNRTNYLVSNYDIKLSKRSLGNNAQWSRLSEKIHNLNDKILFLEFDLLYKQYLMLQEQVAKIENLIRTKISEENRLNEMYEKLFTIPGMGKISSSSLIGCIGDINRFSNVRELVSYLGLCPRIRESGGKSIGGRSITKRGNSLLRGYLTQVAVAVLRSRRPEALPLKLWYERLRKKKGWRTARVALARKMAAIAFGVLKTNRSFDPGMISIDHEGSLTE